MTKKPDELPAEVRDRLRALVAVREDRVRQLREAQAASKEASNAFTAAALEVLKSRPTTVRAIALAAGFSEIQLRTMMHRMFGQHVVYLATHKEPPHDNQES